MSEGIPCRLRGAVAALSVAVLLVGALTATTWASLRESDRRDRAQRQSVAAAAVAAPAIYSYDYRTFDASVITGRAVSTGAFARRYLRDMAALRPAAEADQAVVRAETVTAGVVDADADRVELLVHLTRYQRAGTAEERVERERVLLTMVAVDGAWKVAAARTL